ncbi:MAG: hypothetical protein GY930_10925, partial [bacterium]|nr:hypothetical protein [bacterium]
YITFPNHPSFPGVYKRGVYAGTPVSASTYGVVRKQLMDSPAIPKPHEHYHGAQLIEVGHRFVAKVLSFGSPDDEVGDWIPLRAQSEFGPEFDALLTKEREITVQVPAGQNMRDPDGFLILPTVPQPASGEVARHPYTGELDPDGTLVP